ncbi:MAG: ArsR family transcriptional regulator [Planctomycetota bacterium]|nr:ArsR family transcriptional regulator [Planctomycetota bacterium]
MSAQLSQSDVTVIQLLLRTGPLTISQLVDHLGITATAVRQRLSRLQEAELVNRSQAPDGRGRPSHRYDLTEAGRRTVGDNLADLACALWQEIQEIPDIGLRKSLIEGAIRRMADGYASRVVGESVEERLHSAAQIFVERDIPITVEKVEGLPVLRVLQCPYPDLAKGDHRVCEMEKQLFSQVIGGPVDLCQCRHQGDSCCTFQAEPAST